ncbi:MAG: DNA translocase FtsK [Clostridia bacterium]|nr:DNA translocase FtsK [Clostridia bacterium]
MTFNEYITDGFISGKSGQGGGFLAAIPAYALEKLLSVGGAIVVFVALALVMLLLITKVSIRTAGKKVIARVDAIEDRRKARFINETVGDDYPAPRRRRQTAAAAAAAPELVLGGDKGSETLSETFTTRRRRRLKAEEKDLDTVIREAEPAARTDPQLDVLPTSGKLPRDGSMFGELKAPPVVPADVYQPPEVPDYDPFETIEIVPEDNITGEKPGVDESAPAVEEKPADKPEVKAEAADLTEPPAVQVYQKPPLSLLKKPDHSEVIANDSPSEKAKLLIETLASFNINARVMNISVGPVITRFEIQPAQGVRVNRITSLHNDLALALAAPRVRIEAPIPGKAAIGIEIPNKDTAMVRLREVIDTREFSAASSPLTFGLGKDIAGKPVYADLEKMPHMLIAGATGSGKSVCINSIILSTVYKSSPDDVRMILIDPKVVELSIFAPVPHLYCPIVTDPKKAAGVLKWACNEMDQRYSKMSKVNARDLSRYNSLMKDPADRMPRLMIIIDELADLMIVSAKDVEESIARIAQLGRAAGIHLIVATQRPSVDVITGLIKANIPSRIAFAVSSAIDSRVILDAGGAEKLLGHGDMLFHPNGAAKPTRAQGAYVSDEEVENIMQFFVDNRIEIPQDNNVLDSIPDLTASTGQGNGKQEDELLPDAVRIVMDSGSASISMIQRRLRVGYARAARLVDIMEQMKLVSGFDGSKPRKVLIDEAGYQELFGSGSD